MFQCYFCKFQGSTIDIYITHLKCMHISKQPKTNFIHCNQMNCTQAFHNISALKKHLKIHLRQNVVQSLECTDVNYEIPESSFFSVKDSDLNESQDTFDIYDDDNDEPLAFDVNDTYFRTALTFVMKLCNSNNISRKQIFQIANDTIDLTKIIADNIETCSSEISSFCNNPFEKIKTEHLLLKVLIEMELYDHPTQFVIDTRLAETFVKGDPFLKNVAYKGTMLPVVHLLKSIFQLPNMLSGVLENQDNLSKETNICNFVNGSVWKEIKSEMKGKTVIPYSLFYDDFEPDNPLGSHKTENAIGAFYFGFPTMPQFLCSLLENIIPTMLIKANYIKMFSTDNCLQLFVDTLLMLENDGIEINGQRVYFVLGYVAGDNLGLNSLLGFSKGFNALHYCRICRLDNNKASKAVSEDVTSLRNVTNYESDIDTNDFQLTGIHDRCILNKLRSFHVTRNVSVDIMHDLFEGVFKPGMIKVIQYFIDNNYFTLQTLNRRKQLFDYGDIENANRSMPIKLEHLQSKKIIMSACEMWTFVHFFSLMIGDLVPPNCTVWKFYLNMQYLLDLCLRSSYSEESLTALNAAVAYHNTQFMKLFNQTLQPKAHFLTHYVTIIRRLGPLKHLWCMRFEAKHREMKVYCKVNYSRRNICYSLAIRTVLKFAARIYENESFKFIRDVKGTTVEYRSLGRKPYFKQIRPHITDIKEDSNVTICKWIRYKGTLYKPKYFLMREGATEVYEITEILYFQETILLVCKSHTSNFIKNYNAFSIVFNNNEEVVINISSINTCFPMNCHLLANSKFCRPKYI